MPPVHLRELLKEPRDQAEQRRSTLLRLVMANPGSQTNLAQRAGLSEATVSQTVRELERQEVLRVERLTGRENFVRMAPMMGAAVGVELGFHRTLVVARRVDQRFDEAVTRPVRTGAAFGERWVPDLADAVRDAVDELGEDEIVSIGLGVPRMVDPQTALLVPPALPPWRDGDDPAEMLAAGLRQSKRTPRLVAPRIVLDNDANLAAYAESVYVHTNVETLVGIKASTGIGAGIVVGGRLFRGRRGVAGEIGHIVVDPGGRFCSCGGRGCLEAVIGADALVEYARSVIGHRKQESPETIEGLVEMAARGNPVCQRVLREAGATLGFTIGNLCNILNPDVIVLGGAFGYRQAVNFTLPPLSEAVRQTAMAAAIGDRGVTIQGSTLANAGAHGALVIALEGTEYPDHAE